MTNPTTTAHHACAGEMKKHLWANGKLAQSDLATTVAFYDSEGTGSDTQDPRSKKATQISTLLLCSGYGINHGQAAVVNEGPSGKFSRFVHTHGVLYLRDFTAQSKRFQVSLSRWSQAIEMVLCSYFDAPIGFRARKLTDLGGWCYYMTKGWKHSEYLFGEDKDNVNTQTVYAPCLPDDVVAQGIRADAIKQGWHRESISNLVGVIAELVKRYLATYDTSTVVAETTNVGMTRAWRMIVGAMRTLDRALNADGEWRAEVRKRYLNNDLDEAEVPYGQWVADRLARAEQKAQAKVARAQKKAQKAQAATASRSTSSTRKPGIRLEDAPTLNDREWDEVIRRVQRDPSLSMMKEAAKVGRATAAKRKRQAKNAERRDQQRKEQPDMQRIAHYRQLREEQARRRTSAANRLGAQRRKACERMNRLRQQVVKPLTVPKADQSAAVRSQRTVASGNRNPANSNQ